MFGALNKYAEVPPFVAVGYEPKTTFWGDFGVADVYGVSAVELESVQALIGIEVDNNTHVGAFLHEAKNVLTGTTVSYIHFMRFKSNSP